MEVMWLDLGALTKEHVQESSGPVGAGWSETWDLIVSWNGSKDTDMSV